MKNKRIAVKESSRYAKRKSIDYMDHLDKRFSSMKKVFSDKDKKEYFSKRMDNTSLTKSQRYYAKKRVMQLEAKDYEYGYLKWILNKYVKEKMKPSLSYRVMLKEFEKRVPNPQDHSRFKSYLSEWKRGK
jgi:hypothetical protein